MLKDQFIGRNPSHFQVNPVVKAFIISETLLWSAYNFIVPIFAIFVVDNVQGGNVQIAASAFSFFLISRVFAELVICRYLSKIPEAKRILFVIMGMVIMSLSYLGFAFSNTVFPLFVFYGMAGVGFWIGSPAKHALFSTHLDKDKEPTEWGVYDATHFFSMALAGVVGGFIASQYGFQILFFLASAVNLLGTIPYLLYIRS